MLKRFISKTDLAALPESIRGEYKERSGKTDEYELDLEGGHPDDKIKEFRENNVTLQKALDGYKKDWEGLDPKRVRDVMTREEEIMNGKIYKEEGLTAAVEKATGPLKEAHAKQLAAEKARADQAEAELVKLRVDGALVEEATKLGVLPDALELLTATHRPHIKLENGAAVIYEPDGTTKRYGSDAKPMTIKELLEAEAKKRPYLFKPAKGAESSGSGNGGGGADDGSNPWNPKSVNKTAQQKIMSEDPAKAKRMAAAHGVTLHI